MTLEETSNMVNLADEISAIESQEAPAEPAERNFADILETNWPFLVPLLHKKMEEMVSCTDLDKLIEKKHSFSVLKGVKELRKLFPEGGWRTSPPEELCALVGAEADEVRNAARWLIDEGYIVDYSNLTQKGRNVFYLYSMHKKYTNRYERADRTIRSETQGQ